MRVMHGSQNGSVYGDERRFVVIPVTDLASNQQRQYRAYHRRGLDTRALMQIALAYTRPFHLFEMPPFEAPREPEDVKWQRLAIEEWQESVMGGDEHDVVTRIRNLLRHTDLLIEPTAHSREVHQLLDFVADIGPSLRLRLEYYSGSSDMSANIDRAGSQFLIVGVQRRQPEYSRELTLPRGPNTADLRRLSD